MRNVLLILSLTLGAAITAAQPDTDSIVAMFNKTKEKSKTKHGVTYSLFVDVKSVADVKRNPADYSGSYASDFGFTLDLTVAHDGSVRGGGRDTAAFTLRDARVHGALLTGTKVYADGSQRELRGAFLERTTREGTSRAHIRGQRVEKGLGIIGLNYRLDGLTIEKMFYAAE